MVKKFDFDFHTVRRAKTTSLLKDEQKMTLSVHCFLELYENICQTQKKESKVQ